MITDADIKKMKKVFATKDDLAAMEKRQNQKFSTKDDLVEMEKRQDQKYATKDDLKKALVPVNKKLDKIVQYFDRDISWHHRRLKQLEGVAGVKAPEYVSLPAVKN